MEKEKTQKDIQNILDDLCSMCSYEDTDSKDELIKKVESLIDQAQFSLNYIKSKK